METHFFRNAIGIVVIVGGFALLGAMFAYPVPEQNSDILNVALGLVLGWGSAVVAFEFGGSPTKKIQPVTVENSASDPVPVEPQS